MAEEDKSAEDQLHDAVWNWVQRFVVAAVLFGAGLFAGYYQWGQGAEGAVALRQTSKECQDQVVELKNQRETINTKLAREKRDKEVCRRDLKELKSQQPPQ